ncbi:MAG: bifunctional methylenetetrahydrofolate dehydrogenase/methenyltetrahydrofolate cyclohydrolase FolD [Candidatus Alcyoniella australis]|nr:bifunctional methylenetetrahydrofolate dehydrogenase/methenyltetrahydrofolate cyclohydrolase FolD [Candidatus Alcyoniella australis]
MTAQIISGKEISQQIRDELRDEVAEFKASRGIVPGLATVLVGEDPASVSYVRGKARGCEQIGVANFQHNLSADVSEAELLELVAQLNARADVHGILVQLPLPQQIDENKVLYAIDPDKDVDGFHPFNVGRLLIGQERFAPCTPAGIRELLLRSGTQTAGAELVIVGRSNLVGKPLAAMMVQKQVGANATVTICHTRTRELAEHTRRAEILIVAAGRPGAITAEMVKPGATVIDVGVNRIGVTESGKARLCGDVDFEGVSQVAGKITPVPGGVGPMTITMLLKNTVKAAKLASA